MHSLHQMFPAAAKILLKKTIYLKIIPNKDQEIVN